MVSGLRHKPIRHEPFAISYRMDLQIITPDKELFNGQAKRVSVPGVDGSMGFLDHHAPLITVLKAGDVKVTLQDNKVETFALKGGVVEVSHNKVIVLAE